MEHWNIIIYKIPGIPMCYNTPELQYSNTPGTTNPGRADEF
jgi:hypothetical protein